MWQSILSGVIQPSAEIINTEKWLISPPTIGRFFRFSWQSNELSSIPQLWGQIAQIQLGNPYEIFQQQRWKLRESQEVFELNVPRCFTQRRIALQVFNVERQILQSPEIEVSVEVFHENGVQSKNIFDVVSNPLGLPSKTSVIPESTVILPVSPQRAKFTIFNPTNTPTSDSLPQEVYINFGEFCSANEFAFLLFPGGFYEDEIGWCGAMSACTKSQPTSIQVKEFF